MLAKISLSPDTIAFKFREVLSFIRSTKPFTAFIAAQGRYNNKMHLSS